MKLAIPAFITSTLDYLISFNACCRVVILFGFFIGLIIPSAHSQTDFAPGEIMFTGFDSDDADGFSIVLLTDVVSGTIHPTANE